MLSSLRPHILELRSALIKSLLALVIGFFICFSNYEIILNWMLSPIEPLLPKGSQMVALTLQETFFTSLKVSFFSGFILALPVIFYQFYSFIAPGLYTHEKKMALPFVFCATFMFVLGSAFAFWIVIPFGFAFLINFATAIVAVTPNIGAYVSFLTKLLIGFGIAFELPVISVFLAFLGLITHHTLKDFFKYAIVLIFILSAILTPPDVITQILMAAPLILLYALSILLVKLITKDEEEDE